MKKRKLKGYVLPAIYFVVLGVMIVSITFLSQSLLEKQKMNDEDYNYSTSVFEESENDPTNTEVDTTTEIKIVRPYTSDKVTVTKEFYNKDESVENQEKALIFYENTYMPNTGILYGSDEKFDVIAILNGTVKEIKEDEILGQMITIECDNKITAVYYTLGEIKVNEGDQITQNQVIATSGTSNIDSSKAESLLFETYIDGVLTNPNNLFDKSISEIN
mgnify:FL=1